MRASIQLQAHRAAARQLVVRMRVLLAERELRKEAEKQEKKEKEAASSQFRSVARKVLAPQVAIGDLFFLGGLEDGLHCLGVSVLARQVEGRLSEVVVL